MSNFGGAVDLSKLTQKSVPPGMVEANEVVLREYITKSSQAPVLVFLYLPSDALSLAVMNRISEAVTKQAGKLAAIQIDVSAQPELAQAFGVESVPTLLALIAGQPAPIAQGDISAEQLDAMILKVLEVAASNGVVGTFQDEATDGIDPEISKLQQLIDAGDLVVAENEVRAALSSKPGDADLQSLLEQVLLLSRISGLELEAIIENETSDLESLLIKADALMISGLPEQSFNELLQGFGSAPEEDRVQIRQRLLSLFLVVGETPVVGAARNKLASLLF